MLKVADSVGLELTNRQENAGELSVPFADVWIAGRAHNRLSVGAADVVVAARGVLAAPAIDALK